MPGSGVTDAAAFHSALSAPVGAGAAAPNIAEHGPSGSTEASPEWRPGVVVSVVEEYPDGVRRHRWDGGAHRTTGLAGTGRRYALIVAGLVGLASLPTVAAVTAGSASLNGGVDRREPFLARGVEPPFVILPLPPTGAEPPPKRAVPPRIGVMPPEVARPKRGRPAPQRAAPGRGEPAEVTRPRPRRSWPVRVTKVRWVRGPGASARPPFLLQGRRSPGLEHGSAGRWFAPLPGQRMSGHRVCHVPGRNMGGWSRTAGPRR